MNSLIKIIKLFVWFICFYTIFLFSCSESKISDCPYDKDEFFIVDAEKAYNNPEPFFLSDIADTILYVPLETREDMLLDRINQIIINGTLVYLRNDKQVLMFSTTGGAIGLVGSIGRGPGEYINPGYFSVEKTSGQILVQGAYQFVVYDSVGSHLFDVIPKNIKGGNKFIFYEPNRLAFYFATNDSHKPPVNIRITDSLTNEVVRFINSNPTSENRGFLLSHAPLYLFNDELHFKEHYNDTVFKIVNDTMIPKFAVRETEFLIPFDFSLIGTGAIMEKVEKIKDKMMASHIMETPRFVFFTYNKGMPNPIIKGLVYDKSTMKTYYLADEFIKNDLDGGMGFWPKDIMGDSYLVGYRWAYEIKDHVSSKEFKEATSISPTYKARLEQLASSLKHSDNPVLMFVKLKD